MIKREMVEKVLNQIEPDVKRVSKYFSLDFRDEIQQEIRLKLWKYLETEFQEKDCASVDEAVNFLLNFINSISSYASKSVFLYRNKYNRRHTDISVIESTNEDEYEGYSSAYTSKYSDNSNLSYSDKDNTIFDYSKTLERYKKILSKKEFMIIKYIFDVDHKLDNLDALSRELGYTGKGSSKYQLKNIAMKIRNDKEMNA